MMLLWIKSAFKPHPMLSLLVSFIFACSILCYTIVTFLSVTEGVSLKFPKSMEDVKELSTILTELKNDHFATVLWSYIVLYVFLQAFAIPGSAMLSVLSGALFQRWFALLLVCLCSGVGASICYLLSNYLAKPIIQKYWADRLIDLSNRISAHREHLLNYLMFLRITPILPNWFINIASPHLGVPIYTFFTATCIGVVPISFLHVQAGVAIHQLSSGQEITLFNITTILTILVAGFLSLAPVFLKRMRNNSAEIPMSQPERGPLLPR
ncbi:hypothetical protein K7432_003730 [Basidiobolus ranarum]|uniref:VTT domain-containing protein n=1 Tax=Basidiobolus ranarum TaxID=34480 RepID=A0ABR2WZI3_9FUNG